MAGDEALRNGIRQNMGSWTKKLSCDGDVETQIEYKMAFVERLRSMPVAIDTDKANEQHYEVPTDFFLTVLGQRLKYSGCYWPEGVDTLDQAEDASLKQYCERAQIEDGQTVMDLGCGWGSLTLYICEKFPNCRVTCVSNSNTQREFITSRARELGYADRVKAITADANVFTISEKFDRIITIELIEHMKNYGEMFRRISTWLTPAGYLFIQVFCHKDTPYSFDSKPGSDTEWMAKNFFTGGTMPSRDLFLYFQEHVHVVSQWFLKGSHYSKTLEAWLVKTDENKSKVMDIFQKTYGEEAEKNLHNWRKFFMYCSEVFGHNGGNEWGVTHFLMQKHVLNTTE